MHKYKINYKVFRAVVTTLLIASLLLAYAIPSQDPVSKFAKMLYPAIAAGTKAVSVQGFYEQTNVALALENRNQDLAAEKIIRNLKSEVLLQKLGIKLSSLEIQKEEDYLKFGKEDQYQELLKRYFKNNPDLFTKTVSKVSAAQTKIMIKYNSDFKKNFEAINKARTVLSQLKAGKSFEELASAESADLQSSQFGGDLGFFQPGELIPELSLAILNSSVGQASQNIVVSRYGYHIVYPIETAENSGKKLWHAKHILIETEGYEQWLESQFVTINVIRLK